MHPTPSFQEDQISQIPALQLLQNLGYTYLTSEEALALRGGRMSAVLLDGILAEQLRKINRIRFKGNEYPFSEGNILSAMQMLKELIYDGLVRTNEKVYDLLCLGRSMQQSIEGDYAYIVWTAETADNVYEVGTDTFVVRDGKIVAQSFTGKITPKG